MKASYKPNSVQRFKKSVGDATKYATGTHLCLSHLDTTSIFDIETQKRLAVDLKIRVDEVDLPSLISQNISQSIVSLYSSFDEYLSNLKGEFQRITDNNWKERTEYSPFQALLENAVSRDKIVELKSKFLLFDYYRKIRNHTVHPKAHGLKEIEEWFRKNSVELSALGKSFGLKESPNRPSDLKIHDMKLFCQLLLELGFRISEAFDPGDEIIANYVRANHSYDSELKELRVKNCVSGYIKTNFGVSENRAEIIVTMVLAQ